MQNAQNGCCMDAKTLTILQDQMEHEAVACKKYEAYAAQFGDQTLSQHASNLANHHKQHFDSLFQYLNSHN